MLSTSHELSAISKSATTLPADLPAVEAQPGFTPLLYLKRHPVVAVATFLTLFVLGGTYLRLFRGPTYQAASIVYVSPIFPNALAEDHQHDREYDAFMEQQIFAVTRAENLKIAVDKFRSYWVHPGEDDHDAITRLQNALVVEQMGHSYQMSISLKMPYRYGVADFLNEITRDYVTSAHNDELYGRDSGVTALTADKARITGELDAAMRAQDTLLSELGIARFDPKAGTNPFDTEMQKLSAQLSDAHEKRAEADAQSVAFGARAGVAAPALREAADAEVNTDPSVITMAAQLDTKRSALMLQMNGLTPENPLYKQSQAELTSIDRQIADLRSKASTKIAGRLQQKYSTESERAARLESQLNADLSKTRQRAAEAAPRLQHAEALSAEIDRLQASSAMVQNRINQLDLESSSPGSEHVVSWAVTPTQPEGSHTRMYWLALLFASLCAAMVAALFVDVFDPMIYTSGDIQRLIGFPPIGMLLDDRDFSPTMRSEYLLRLAVGIDQAYRRTAARTFVFTSAGTGSTCDLVKQLGTELANNGLKTLVILVDDAPASDARAGQPAQPETGLATTAKASQELATAKDGEGAPPLFELMTKAPHGLPAFLRASRTAYTTILIAADPVLLSAHTEHLVRTADGTVLVAESGTTTKKQLVRVARLLERLKISGIAIVLSQIRKRHADEEVVQNLAEYAQHIPLHT